MVKPFYRRRVRRLRARCRGLRRAGRGDGVQLGGEQAHAAALAADGQALAGQLGELGRGARVQAQLVDDFEFFLNLQQSV